MEIDFECGGVRLFARELGHPTSPPIVYVHGGLADHRAALAVVGLSKTYRLIAPDMRGAGRSHYTGELSWTRFADDLAALLDHLQLDRAVVGGASMGCGVATAFALRHPDRLAGAIFMSPLYPGADRELGDPVKTAMAAMHELGERTLVDGMDALLPLYAGLPDHVREGATEMARSFDPGSVAATTRFLATLRQPFESASQLRAITARSAVIPGLDPQHPREVAELYAANLPNAVVLEQTPELVPALAQLFLPSADHV